MNSPEFHYRWQWHLQSSCEALWPFVADTNRFNRDTGVPEIERRDDPKAGRANGRRLLRLERLGIAVEWEEEPFEWTRPSKFGVVRHYHSGPVAAMRVLVELTPAPGGGCALVYQVWATPRNWLGFAAIPAQIGLLSKGRFEATLRRYDRAAAHPYVPVLPPAAVQFVPGAHERLAGFRDALLAQGADANLLARLAKTIETADDLDLMQIRPYALADAWGVARRGVLELCLRATRVGLLESRWKLLCPLCRGSRESSTTLRDVHSRAHCDSCNIDFTANFERSVELTFRPSPTIREGRVQDFCVGGPRLTPHIVVQQLLAAGTTRELTVSLEAGYYRLRTLALAGGQSISASDAGTAAATLRADASGWPADDLAVSIRPLLQFANATPSEQLFILERTAWTDQAATAADVIELQLFRDLFATEALRPGEEFSVGSVAIAFTDLRKSTELYQEIGDAVAFGWVLKHFDVLKEAIASEDGAVVKTIGDAVMAVFRRPAPALRAMLAAQARLASPPAGQRPLPLKVGLHFGPCIAVTLNDRLDYFGSTINIAARLEGQSSGTDVLISDQVRRDPEVTQWLADHAPQLQLEPVSASLKGFDERTFELWRVSAKPKA